MNYSSKWNHIVSISFFNHIVSKLVTINGKSHMSGSSCTAALDHRSAMLVN
jgi:hypothetical protein